MPRKTDGCSHDILACTLCRSGRQSISTLERAAHRKIQWPEQTFKPPSFKDPQIYTSIDEAFDTVTQFMNMTTRQCKRYFGCGENKGLKVKDNEHCNRFHTERQYGSQFKNPLQKPDNVQIEMAPGTYAISAERWGAERDHTHVVHVTPGQTIDLTFGV